MNRASWLRLAAATHCVETFHPKIFLTGVYERYIPVRLTRKNWSLPADLQKLFQGKRVKNHILFKWRGAWRALPHCCGANCVAVVCPELVRTVPVTEAKDLPSKQMICYSKAVFFAFEAVAREFLIISPFTGLSKNLADIFFSIL